VDVSVRLGAGTSSRVVIDGLTFSVKRGEFVTLVGASGIGKTTILRTLGGLQTTEPPSRISLNGEPVTGPSRGVVLVFQDYFSSLLPWRTVEKNVRLGIEGKVPKGEYSERVGTALRSVGLADRGGDYPAHLSGGMQQRVQIARALAMKPSVLLMDEPFGALDAMTKQSMQDQLQQVQALTGMTVVFVTHDVEEAVYLSDRVTVLTGRHPAGFGHEIKVSLERPRNQIRTKEQPEYLRLRHQVYEALGIRGDHG
jgi:NitT/TauT family transport system ATP-binding protein